MKNSCHIWGLVFLTAFALFTAADTARAEFAEWQGFTSPLGVFAVPPNPAQYWSLDPGCSPGVLISGRGDGGDLKSIVNIMPPGIGTRLVRDFNPGPGSSTIGSMAHSGIDVIYHLFLSADDGQGTHGQEFYRVLGSLYPVMALKVDVNPGPVGSMPMHLTHHVPGGQGKMFFTADNGTHGRELWVSNTAPTMISTEWLVHDINPGPAGSDPDNFGKTINSSTKPLVFAANDGVHGRELWCTYSNVNPPVYTTILLKDINPTGSSDPQSMRTVVFDWTTNSKAFFTADDGVNGRELWRTDGTVAGTFMLKDIVPGAGSSNPANLTAVTEQGTASGLFFTVGTNLWFTKGATVDTLVVKDVGGTPANLTVVPKTVGYTLFFTVGNTLWKSNNTAAGTLPVATFNTVPSGLMGVKGWVYFAADDGSGAGLELWKSDGTVISLVKDIYPGSTGSAPSNLLEVGDVLFFTANDGIHGRELWKSDGTEEGSVLIKDINPGSAGSNPDQFFAFEVSENVLFFTADDGTHGRELWQSDGFAEVGENRNALGYKWDLASVISDRVPGKVAAVATDEHVITIGATFDMPVFGGGEGLSPAAHQANYYFELTDGTDRAPLDISYVDCGDGNLPRPRAPLTDGSDHNSIAFGIIAVLDQDPCDQDPRGEASPASPFAYVPAIYDGRNWIPMDREHITPGVVSNPPSGTKLSQADRGSNFLPAGLPDGMVPATTDPYSQRRYTWIRLEIWGDYLRAHWYSKNAEVMHVATIPRHYKGAFKALHFGAKAELQSAYPVYFDSLYVNGGLFVNSSEPYAACCTPAGCIDVEGFDACADGIMTAWRTCDDPATPKCCPIPWADSDWDGDVDMDDFALLQRCLTPGGGQLPDQCACFDRNGDNVINSNEIDKFITCGTGSNILATPEQAAACDAN